MKKLFSKSLIKILIYILIIFCSLIITYIISFGIGSIDSPHFLILDVKNPFFIQLKELGDQGQLILKYPNFAVVIGLFGLTYEILKIITMIIRNKKKE